MPNKTESLIQQPVKSQREAVADAIDWYAITFRAEQERLTSELRIRRRLSAADHGRDETLDWSRSLGVAATESFMASLAASGWQLTPVVMS